MNKSSLSKINFDLWLLIGNAQHSILLVRQRELGQYHIPIRQLHVLRVIQDLGLKATIPEVAKQVDRELHAISKQTVRMEKDGLIRRIKATPKSNLLKLELTEKGVEIAKLARQSQSIDKIFSVLPKEKRQELLSMLYEITTKAKNLASARD